MLFSDMLALDKNIHLGTIPEDAQKAEQPKGMKIPLKDHQLKLLHYMEHFESGQRIPIPNKKYIHSNFGFVCDKVGSGKSYVILSLIANNPNLQLPPVRDTCVYFHQGVEVYQESHHPSGSFKPVNFLVVPHGIVHQWQEYIKNSTDLRFAVIRTNDQVEAFTEKDLDTLDLVLVSGTRYNSFISKFNYLQVSRLIFDEVDSINIPGCGDYVKPRFTWLISSSINNVLNGRNRNTGLIRYLMQALSGHNTLSYLILKNPDSIVEKSLQLTDPKLNEIICKNDKNIQILHGFVDKTIFEMISAGAIQDAIQAVHMEQTSADSLVGVVCKSLVSELHNRKVEYEMKLKMNYSSKKAKEQALELQSKKIAELESKIDLIQKRIAETDMDPITYEDIEDPVITRCCQNKFDIKSLAPYLKKQKDCPMCRQPLDLTQLVYLSKNSETKVEEPEAKEEGYDSTKFDKYENLKTILMEKITNPNKKILIFSEYDESFVKITDILVQLKLRFRLLQGSSVVVKSIVEEYKNSNLDVLMLNAQHFGAGLNLENTTDIVIFHRMHVDLEKQVIGRAQRLGRKTQLNVWQLRYQNEQY